MWEQHEPGFNNSSQYRLEHNKDCRETTDVKWTGKLFAPGDDDTLVLRSLPEPGVEQLSLPAISLDGEEQPREKVTNKSDKLERTSLKEEPLATASSMMRDDGRSTSKQRLELARPHFEEAIRVGDLVDRSKIYAELHDILKKVKAACSPDAKPISDDAQAELAERTRVLFVALRESGRARIEYAKVLNRVAVESKDPVFNENALDVLKTLQEKVPCYQNDPFTTGAIKILSESECKPLSDDEAVKLGEAALAKQKAELESWKTILIGLGGTAVIATTWITVVNILNYRAEKAYEKWSELNKGSALDSAAREVQRRLPEKLRRSLPKEFHPDVLEALEGMMETERSVNSSEFPIDIKTLVRAYKSKIPGAVEGVNGFISRGKIETSSRHPLPKESFAERDYISVVDKPGERAAVPIEIRVESLAKPMKILAGPNGIQCLIDVSNYDGIRFLRGIPARELTAAKVESHLSNIVVDVGPYFWDRYPEYRDTLSSKFCRNEEERLRAEYRAEVKKLVEDFRKCESAVDREAFCSALAKRAIKASELEKASIATVKTGGPVGIIVSVKEGECVTVWPDGKLERTVDPLQTTCHKTDVESRSLESARRYVFPAIESIDRPDSNIEGMTNRMIATKDVSMDKEKLLRKIEDKLSELDQEIALVTEVSRQEALRTQLSTAWPTEVDKLKELHKELVRIRADFQKRDVHELKSHYGEKSGDKSSRSGGAIAGNAATAVALLMVAGWMMDASAKSLPKAPPSGSVLPQKR